ncbi:hypothetical protein C1H46_002040 [Malus baccata]|uniref:BHLH domain-containing protein n=1 Tax=Malus baccata TaxID=106549 RepID=A0A540NMY4_MALBA|nr:hypothetical protein C1H46_002040 [Malus baccata]
MAASVQTLQQPFFSLSPPSASNTPIPMAASVVTLRQPFFSISPPSGSSTHPHGCERSDPAASPILSQSKASERKNSSKTDKASMLYEIIEYVRLLQLQVKELSMSKIGASGVVAVDEHEGTSSPTYLTNSYNSLESWVAQDVSSILQDFEPDAQGGGKSCEVQNMGM